MAFPDDFRRCLDDLDVAAMRALWRHVSPGLPQPENDHEVLATIHRARTEAGSIEMRKRAYSHRWLLDHGYPSGLPDDLRPRAERLYPRVAECVGIAALRPQPYTPIVQAVMRDAVMECYADGRTEPEFVKARMMEARGRERKALGLPT